MKFEVIVGNIGAVYSGNNFMTAMSKYCAYVELSKADSSRAGGEPVTLMHNGRIRNEYNPPAMDADGIIVEDR